MVMVSSRRYCSQTILGLFRVHLEEPNVVAILVQFSENLYPSQYLRTPCSDIIKDGLRKHCCR